MARNFADSRGIVGFTCDVGDWKTNEKLGLDCPPKKRIAAGSVLAGPLLESGDKTLWLEHVSGAANGAERRYWLVWYDKDGTPLSDPPVFTADGIIEMAAKLSLNIIDRDQLARTLSLVAP